MENLLEGWVLVTKESHPTLFESFEDISHDRGSGAGHDNYSVPPEWVDTLNIAEKCLVTLSEEERQEFAIGEQGEVEKIATRSQEFSQTHKMLNSFFEDWN